MFHVWLFYHCSGTDDATHQHHSSHYRLQRYNSHTLMLKQLARRRKACDAVRPTASLVYLLLHSLKMLWDGHETAWRRRTFDLLRIVWFCCLNATRLSGQWHDLELLEQLLLLVFFLAANFLVVSCLNQKQTVSEFWIRSKRFHSFE